MKNKTSKIQEAISHFGENKKKQTLIYIAGVGLVIIFAFGVSSFTSSKKKSDKFYSSQGVRITDLSKSTDPEGEWMAKSEEQMSELAREFIKLKNDKLAQEKKLKYLKTDHDKKISDLQKKLANSTKSSESKKKSAKKGNIPSDPNKYNYKTNSQNAKNWGQDFIEQGGIEDISLSPESRDIETFEFSYDDKKNKRIFNLENYLPAGSYAQATLLSSVDAGVGLQSQTDPRPVLFRVTSDAFTSKFKNENQAIDIKGCTVTGAASGDISSEKVYIRLLKMTCSDEENQVIETKVSGYAAALGKAGIRGPVISREGDYLVKAFFAGIVSGFGEGAASRFQPDTSFVNGITAQKQTTKNIIGEGLGRGTANSAARLEEYLINRAEQYQPVISIPAGIGVELVFIEGVHLDGTIKAISTSGNTQNNNNNKEVK